MPNIRSVFQVALAIALCIVVPLQAAVGQTPPAPKPVHHAKQGKTPDLSGRWHSSVVQATMDIKETDSKISGVFDTPFQYHHVLGGKYDVKTRLFDCTIERSKNGSKTVMFAHLFIHGKQLIMSVYGTDGRSDLSKTYSSRSVWSRAGGKATPKAHQ